MISEIKFAYFIIGANVRSNCGEDWTARFIATGAIWLRFFSRLPSSFHDLSSFELIWVIRVQNDLVVSSELSKRGHW